MSQFQRYCLIFLVYAALSLNAKMALADKTPSADDSPIFMNLGQEQWKVTNSNGSIMVLMFHSLPMRIKNEVVAKISYEPE